MMPSPSLTMTMTKRLLSLAILCSSLAQYSAAITASRITAANAALHKSRPSASELQSPLWVLRGGGSTAADGSKKKGKKKKKIEANVGNQKGDCGCHERKGCRGGSG
mmetsp:Transcript_27536/g.75156  ORF Transcript_27536/g.75156 Transcript_27536/m.75156 type:complete len:107 (+) Transcript_27536:789-1109(+)